MIEHVWSVICSDAIIDKLSNNLSLINVIEQLNVSEPYQPNQESIIPINMTLVSFWKRTDPNVPTQGEARLVTLRPNGTLKESPQIIQILLNENDRCKSIARTPGITIQGPGYYHLLIQMRMHSNEKWITVSKLPIKVIFTDLATQN